MYISIKYQICQARRENMKKLIAVLVSLVLLLLSFVGCSNSDTYDNDDDRDNARREERRVQSRIDAADAEAKNIHTTVAAAIGVLESRNDSLPTGDFVITADNGWSVTEKTENSSAVWKDMIADRLDADLPTLKGSGVVFTHQGAAIAVAWDVGNTGVEMAVFTVGAGWTSIPPRNADNIYGVFPPLPSDGVPATMPEIVATQPQTTAAAEEQPPVSPNENIPQEFDFGAIRFTSRDFMIRPAETVIIGGNMNGEGGGAEGAIRLFGFQGYPMPAGGFPDYNDGSFHDPQGLYGNLISQNQDFWGNVQRIEASFYLEGKNGADPYDVGYVQTFVQGGSTLSWRFLNSRDNLLEQVSYHGFEFGDVMTANWDFRDFAQETGSSDVAKMGLMIGSQSFVDDVHLTIHWTDVRIFVWDYDVFLKDVANVAAITGQQIPFSTLARIVQV
jgi:hypothetical protein